MRSVSKAMPGPGHDYSQPAPQIVRDVLRQPGRPLDPVTRHTMESGFGHSFARIRVHADESAAASAMAISARAYTVGSDVVFGAGEYAPHSDAGRRLVGHELAHSIEQEHTGARIQRACLNTVCPPLAVSIDALFPRYEAAEKCIQTEYARTHPASKPGISLSYNAEWQHLTGGTPNEVMALNCLRGLETPGAGPNFTARSGMFAAAPDIWDFRNQTMYEITTASGAAVRIGKLQAQIALANKLCSPADCGGLQFMTGPWAPSTGCYALGGDLYFSAFNNQGVIVYQMLKDTSKEVALAALLALMAAALKKSGGGAAGGAVKAAAGAGGRRLVPAYAVASLIAAAALLASGRAEAKPLSGEDPLAALFKSLGQQGTPVPPEIQEMLDADPALKQKISDAMKEGGNPTKVQEELNRQVLDLIAKNKDQFTAEELAVLLASARVTGKSVPQGELTVAELKKLAAAKGVPGEGGDGTTKPASAARKQLAEAPAPVRDLYQSMLGPNAEKTTDAHIQRFLSMLPPGLTAEDAAKLRTMLQKSDPSSIDAVLDSLQAAIAQLGKAAPPEGAAPGDTAATQPDASASTPPPASATLSTEPGSPGAAPIDHQKLVNDLAAQARKSKFGDLGINQYRITWRNPNEKGAVLVGDPIAGTLRGKNAAGVTYVGRIEATITAVDGSRIRLKFITATPMVSADGRIIYPASQYLGREDNVTLDPPKKTKKRK